MEYAILPPLLDLPYLFLALLAVGLHCERVRNIKTSAELNSDAVSTSALETAFDRVLGFCRVLGARLGMQLNRNNYVHVGSALVAGGVREVWAPPIPSPADKSASESHYRAHVVLEAVHDRRSDLVHGDVEIQGLGQLGAGDI
ncbi:hypothetical protein J1614_003898 [Plenodomus biglobosus]|nr:hypothetical protein J1614_003898 [Plenodomus biglobosus]